MIWSAWFVRKVLQTDGGGDLASLYGLASVDRSDTVSDPKNPHFDALLPDPPAAVGEPASGFYDLWLENPAGDQGLSFDVTGRRSHISCNEHDREPCGQRHFANAALDKFDTGSRYDSVLARFSKSNIPNAPGTGNYPNAPGNWEIGLVRPAREPGARLPVLGPLRHDHRSRSGGAAVQSRHGESRSASVARAELDAAAGCQQARLRQGSRRPRRQLPARRRQRVVLHQGSRRVRHHQRRVGRQHERGDRRGLSGERSVGSDRDR